MKRQNDSQVAQADQQVWARIMADLHESFVTVILLLYQLCQYIRSINPIKREAFLLVIHNVFMYYIINSFKHLAQTSINSAGPVNTFYYVPLVYEAPALIQTHEDLHIVLKSTSWNFLETLFRHHLALLLPFVLALLVPRCKLVYVSSLVILSNFTICVCFVYAIWQWLILSGFSLSLRLVPILFLGPVVQLLLMFRFTVLMLMTESKKQEKELSELRQEPLSLRDEFRIRRAGLHHDGTQDFHRSQWQSGHTSCGFLVYRWTLGIFFGIGWFSYLGLYYHKGYWFIYLTNWGFTLCFITSITGAIFVSFYHKSPQSMMNRSCLVKCYWACYWINLILAHMISIVYWTIIFPSDQVDITHIVYKIWTHAVPPLLFTLDHLLVAHPARFLHFIYPIAFALVYVAFAGVYYLLGGSDPRGSRYIYAILDFSKPLQALSTLGMVSVLLVACSTLHYGVYRLRVFIARKLGKLQ